MTNSNMLCLFRCALIGVVRALARTDEAAAPTDTEESGRCASWVAAALAALGRACSTTGARASISLDACVCVAWMDDTRAWMVAACVCCNDGSRRESDSSSAARAATRRERRGMLASDREGNSEGGKGKREGVLTIEQAGERVGGMGGSSSVVGRSIHPARRGRKGRKENR